MEKLLNKFKYVKGLIELNKELEQENEELRNKLKETDIKLHKKEKENKDKLHMIAYLFSVPRALIYDAAGRKYVTVTEEEIQESQKYEIEIKKEFPQKAYRMYIRRD